MLLHAMAQLSSIEPKDVHYNVAQMTALHCRGNGVGMMEVLKAKKFKFGAAKVQFVKGPKWQFSNCKFFMAQMAFLN